MILLTRIWPLAAAILAAPPSPDPDVSLTRGWTWAITAPRPAQGDKGMTSVTSAAVTSNGELLIGGVARGPLRLGSTSVTDRATKVGFVARIDGGGHLRAVRLLDRRESRVAPAEEPAVTALASRANGGFVGSSRAHPLFEVTRTGKNLWSTAEVPRAFSLALAENDDIFAAGCDRRSGGSRFPGVMVQDSTTSGYAARLSSAGKVLWKVSFAGRSGADAAMGCGTSIAAAPGGDVIIGGTFEGELTIGGRVLRADGWNGFIARLSGGGEVRWAKALDSSGTIRVAAMADGRVAVNSDVAGNEGSRRAGVAVLDATGRLLWFVAAETSPPSTPRLPIDGSLVASGKNDVFWVGRFGESVQIAGARLSTGRGEGGLFVARLDGKGQLISLRNVSEAPDGVAQPATRAWPAAIAGTTQWLWVAGELRGTSRGAFAHRLRP